MSLWIRQIATWAKIGLKNTLPYVPLAIVSCAVVFFPNVITDCKEIEVRWLGLLFQIIGVLVVLWQLRDRLKLFQKPSFLSSIRNHLKGFPSRHTNNIDVSGHVSGVATASARVSAGRSSYSSIESRVEALEGEVKCLRKDIRDVEEGLKRHKEDNRNSLETMRKENSREQESLEGLVDEAIVGRIRLEWVGILHLLVGIVLATTAPEIAIWNGYGEQCSQ